VGDNITIWPPLGAGLLKVTVPTELTPPTTEAGDRVSEDKTGTGAGLIVICAVFWESANLAVTVIFTEEATAFVAMLKVPEVLPASTVMLAGRIKSSSGEADRCTTCPPSGAGLLKVTVPTEDEPAVTEAGDIVNADIVIIKGGGVSVKTSTDICSCFGLSGCSVKS